MSLDLEKLNAGAIQVKLANLFLGFYEGLFIDGLIHDKEIDALIKWVEKFPDAVELPYFDNLYKLLLKSVEHPAFLIEKHQDIMDLMAKFKNSSFFVESTCDVQRLHGLLAGLICDGTLNNNEVLALNSWLDQHSYLKTDPIYQEILIALNHVRVLHRVSEDTKEVLKITINKYVQLDNFGLPHVVVSGNAANKNPDFHHGNIFIVGKTICLTGASSRYTKSEWKQVIETKGGIFKDDLTKTADYLVVCNKGNSSWAHMSYGRKFEQALKWQKDGAALLILTEDDFVEVLMGD